MGLFGRKKSDKEIIHDLTFGATELANKGGSYIQQEKFLEAIQELDEALKLKPGYKHALTLKGVALNGLDKDEEALACYDEVVRISDGLYEKVWIYKAETLFKLKKYEEAVECFDKSLKIVPESLEVFLNKGMSLFQLERYEEALESFDKARRINPEIFQIPLMLGKSLDKLERHEEALACHNEAIRINNECAEAWHGRGLAMKSLGRDEAEANGSLQAAKDLGYEE